MAVIQPKWFVERTADERAALRKAFADKPATEVDITLNGAAALDVSSKLLAVVMAMDGHTEGSLQKIKELIVAMRTAQDLVLSLPNDEVITKFWPDAIQSGEQSSGGFDD